MLKSLYLENFKCFKKPTRIQFGAITLLYGKNSSGKSTSVKAAFWLPKIAKAIREHDYEDQLFLFRRRRGDFQEDEIKRLKRALPLADLPSNPESPLDLGDFKDLKNTKLSSARDLSAHLFVPRAVQPARARARVCVRRKSRDTF